MAIVFGPVARCVALDWSQTEESGDRIIQRMEVPVHLKDGVEMVRGGGMRYARQGISSSKVMFGRFGDVVYRERVKVPRSSG